MKMKDYYKILGLERTALAADIKRAYYNLARKYHPDLHQDKLYYLDRFNEINEAYNVLGDLDRRLDYSILLYRQEEIREEAMAKLKQMQKEIRKTLIKDIKKKKSKV